MNEKYFLIRVDNLPWGVIERQEYDFAKARKQYAKLKDKFQNINCVVSLLSAEVIDKETKTTVVYKKQLGISMSIIDISNKINYYINEFDKLIQTQAGLLNKNNLTSKGTLKGEAHKIFHGIELLCFSQTTGEERDEILYNLEEALAIRRATKTQLLIANQIKPQIKAIKSNLKMIDNAIKVQKDSSNKHFYSSKGRKEYIAYFNSLGLELKEFYPELFEQEIDIEPEFEVNSKEIINNINLDEQISFDKYDDKYDEYEDLFA